MSIEADLQAAARIFGVRSLEDLDAVGRELARRAKEHLDKPGAFELLRRAAKQRR